MGFDLDHAGPRFGRERHLNPHPHSDDSGRHTTLAVVAPQLAAKLAQRGLHLVPKTPSVGVLSSFVI